MRNSSSGKDLQLHLLFQIVPSSSVFMVFGQRKAAVCDKESDEGASVRLFLITSVNAERTFFCSSRTK